MRGGDVFLVCEVGDCACDPQDARVGPRGESEAVARGLKEPAAAGIDVAKTPDLAPGNVSVHREGSSVTARSLPLARGYDAHTHGGRGLFAAHLVRERRHGDPRHLDVQVDAIEERPGDSCTVAIENGRCTATLVRDVPQPSAHAGFRCLDELRLIGRYGTYGAARTSPIPARLMSRKSPSVLRIGIPCASA